MNKSNLFNLYKYIIIVVILFVPSINNAQETILYADNISYDSEENIVARGNAKIFYDNQYIFSDLIIYEKKNEKIILPIEFTLRDEKNNFYSGTNGYFEKDLGYGEFENVKILLNDGSRIIGKSGKRDGHIDIITKGVYTPCKSRIKIGNFICPTWQLEGEKILHDNKNLFLYQKHAKIRILNTPVYYIPYIVTPSPLRKERKSGFLSPTISFNFFDTKTAQSTSFPYYFNISTDKELTFVPTINYGAGVDSSQRFFFDYNQLLSGGRLNVDMRFDSNFEMQNSNKWFKDASLITSYNQNIDDKFRIEVESALETSKNYIQKTIPDDDLSYSSSLSTKVNLHGYNFRQIDDKFLLNFSFYTTNQNNEDNKTTPTVLPFIQYYSGNNVIKGSSISNNYSFYNIFRDLNTDIHSQNQQKLSHTLFVSREVYGFNSKVTYKSELHNQIFETENKLIQNNKFHTGTYVRVFPIVSASIETPFKFKNDNFNLVHKPYTQLVISPGMSNSNKISNEDSSNNSFTISNASSLNRYSGTDKLDNSKRLNYGYVVNNNQISLSLTQNYEFTDNSNFHIEQGNNDNLSDLLGAAEYKKDLADFKNDFVSNYNFRYDFDDDYLKRQNISITSPFKLGNISASYLDQRSKVDNIIKKDTETLGYSFESFKFLNFSTINIDGLYDLQKEINTEYSIGYRYFDECFGINLDFKRKSYEEDDLKPQDMLTLMFSFKNIGSYKSTNLAVSETDKQEIRWESQNIEDEEFFRLND